MSAQIIAFPHNRIVRSFEVITQEKLEAMAVEIAERMQQRQRESEKERLGTLAKLIQAEMEKEPPAKKPGRKR